MEEGGPQTQPRLYFIETYTILPKFSGGQNLIVQNSDARQRFSSSILAKRVQKNRLMVEVSVTTSVGVAAVTSLEVSDVC